jgi:hypothetical protein
MVKVFNAERHAKEVKEIRNQLTNNTLKDHLGSGICKGLPPYAAQKVSI